jgi:hypothetical protein
VQKVRVILTDLNLQADDHHQGASQKSYALLGYARFSIRVASPTWRKIGSALSSCSRAWAKVSAS